MSKLVACILNILDEICIVIVRLYEVCCMICKCYCYIINIIYNKQAILLLIGDNYE